MRLSRLHRFIALSCLFSLAACGPVLARPSPIPFPTYDTQLPFPVPASCPVYLYADRASLTPEMLAATPYWIVSGTLGAGRLDGPVWRSGANTVVWASFTAQPSVETNLLEGTSGPATVQFAPGGPPMYRSTIDFPLNGCWEVIGTAGSARLRFIVYAYAARFVQ